MGSMSASDAAPLPRLGEVYFDVRGESRSMRLSWYADTGVAVFSIWQGGTCTGTFRLPIADLPRMVEALQRGPDGDSGAEEELPAGQGRRRGSPAPEPRAAPPGGDTGAGQDPTVAQRPRSGRHHGDDRGPASYSGSPGGELGAEPSTGPRDELDPGYPGGRSSSRHRDEPGERYPEGRRASGHRAASYADEPTGVYRREDDPYADGEADGRYRHEPKGSHRDDGPARPYRDDDLSDHHADSLGRAYRDDSPPGSGAVYHDDSPPAEHEQEPSRQYPGDRSRTYEQEHTAAYSRGSYDDEPTGVYRGDLLHDGYEDDRGGRYSEREYTADPLASDYPTGPSALDYPGADDARGYPPAASRDSGYSPARPYVTPQAREAGQPPEEAVAHEPRRSRGRRDDEAEPDSFPYGQPSGEHSARGSAR